MSPAREPLLRLADVAEILNISASQVYALVRRGDLETIRIGGRNQIRVDPGDLDAYIERAKAEARKFVEDHPFSDHDVES